MTRADLADIVNGNDISMFQRGQHTGLKKKTHRIFRLIALAIDLYGDTSSKGTLHCRVDGGHASFGDTISDDIARNLIESLGTQVMKNDLDIFDNTLTLIDKDMKELSDQNKTFENKITEINEEIREMYKELDGFSNAGGSPASNELNYDIIEKKGEILLYRDKIIDNNNEIKRLDELYKMFEDEKGKVHNRVEIVDANPDYNVENSRAINSIIVILLSILTGIIVVLVVNYIYKIRENINPKIKKKV